MENFCFPWRHSQIIEKHTGVSKIREFGIQSMVGKDPVELEKYSSEEDMI
jgi:hypothetical protein